MNPVTVLALLLAASLPATDETQPAAADAANNPSVSVPHGAASPPAGPPVREDGLATEGDDYVGRFKGRYELWENIGDDGLMCTLRLTDARTIGGYRIEADPTCLKQIRQRDVTGLAAWFVAPDDGHLVMVDAARTPLIRLGPSDNPQYFSNDVFYLVREP